MFDFAQVTLDQSTLNVLIKCIDKIKSDGKKAIKSMEILVTEYKMNR